jgi:hypothetical protein
MSFDNDNMIGTIPPGFLAPADGNYAPNGAQSAALRLQLFPMRGVPATRVISMLKPP